MLSKDPGYQNLSKMAKIKCKIKHKFRYPKWPQLLGKMTRLKQLSNFIDYPSFQFIFFKISYIYID